MAKVIGNIKCPMCLLQVFLILFVGCAGRQANPIPAYLPGDENRSCPALQAEIAQLESDMQRILPETNKFGYNAVCATAGFFLIVPFFFMDLKDADKIEWEAMRTRHNRLIVYASEKGCDFGGKTPDKILSPEEAKKLSEDAKKQKSKITQKQDVNTQLTDEPKEAGRKISTAEEAEKAPVTKLGRFSGQKETCSNCGRTIPRLEQHFIIDNKIVCKECYAKKSSTNIVKQVPDSNSYNKQTQAEPNMSVKANVEVVRCENCGRLIGKLETPYSYDGHVVCAECFARLKSNHRDSNSIK